MARFTSELSGSLIFKSGSVSQASLVPKIGALGLTGSLNITGSSLTFNGSDVISRIYNLETNVGDSVSIGPLNTHSASINSYTASAIIDSASVDTRLNSLTSSVNSNTTDIAALQAATSSYLTSVPSGTISGSTQISDLGFVTSSGDSIPAGTVSSSQQILDFGFVTSSNTTSASYAVTSDTASYVLGSNVDGAVALATTSTTASYVLASNVDGIIPTASLAQTASFISDAFISESAARSGFGVTNIPAGTVSSSQQISDLGFITSSSENDTIALGVIHAHTASYYVDSASFDQRILNITSSGGGDTTGLLSTASYQVDSASFDSRIDAINTSVDVTYDGDRIISSEYLPEFFSASFNPGTSGSVQDFLDAVFFPNTAPTFTSTGSFFAAEYTTSGSVLGTVTATDAEGQALTFRANSAYTAGLVVVASNGTLTLAQAPTVETYNTEDRGDGVQAHPVLVDAVDTFGGFTTTTVYIVINVNNAPVFRQTSTSGAIITSFTSNRNENASSGLVGRIYFTDADGDTITINSSSVSDHFSLTKYGTYVQINQVTGSLDYETTSSYAYSITASDEHYEAGDDLEASASLLITINVVDNVIPVVNDQTLGTINENSSNGASVGSIVASDDEGDTITFRNFELNSMQLDGVDVPTGSYGGTAQLTDPHEDPFQMSNTGAVTRKSGVYLNSDLVNKYIYSVEVVDSYNTASDAGLITINISDDTPASLSDNWSAGPYIKESELSGTTIKTTNYGSTTADYNSNQSGTWSSSNPAVSINSSGNLSLGVNLSGSVTQSGDTLDSTITFTNTFGTTTTDSLSVTIVGNDAPTADFSNSGLTGNYNTNLATDGTALLSSTISDTESDTPYQMTIGGTNGSSFTPVPQNSDSSSWQIQANGDLSAGSYTYDVTVTDSYSETTTYSGRTLTIAQADTGTLGGDTTSYIIESAVSGDSLRDASGYNAGNTSQVSVSYSPNYGSQVVQSYTSSNSAIVIDGSGNLTLGVNISGSSTGSGDTITTTITYNDQYGNIGSGSVTVSVFANGAPTATFTNNSSIFNENQATGSSSLVDVSITDTESETPYGLTLGGTNASSLSAVPQNAASSSWEIQPASNLSAGTYTYDVTVSDTFGKTTTYSGRTITIAAADDGTLVATDAYIIESAVNGDLVRRNSDGRTGTQSSVAVSYSPNYGSQAATNFASSNALIDIDSAGRLSVGTNISGSGQTNGSIIATTITWNDQHGNSGSQAISVDVTENFSPTISFTNTSANLNTNLSRSGSTLSTISFSDTEGDAINYSSFVGTESNGLNFKRSGASYLVQPTGSLAAGTYFISASIRDEHGFSTTTTGNSFTISQASNGTLGGDTSIYSIESATNGTAYRDATGYNNGNPAQVTVSYSPNYGSAVVQSFTSSNAAITIDNSGYLTLGVDLSGSTTQSGDTITSLITFRDQYDNIGSGAVTASIFGNQSPTASFTATSDYDTDGAVSGSTAGTLTVTDTESNTPFTITLAGTDGGKFAVSGSTSPFAIRPTGSLASGTYSINITVADNYDETVTLTGESIVVTQAADVGKVYVYDVGFWDSTYNNNLGIQSVGSGTPPSVTSYTNFGFVEKIEDGNLGDSSFTYSWGSTRTATLLESGSDGGSLGEVLQNMSTISRTNSNRFVILAPSGSDLTVPSTMTDGYGGTTVGEYVLEAATDGTALGSGLGTTEASNIHTVSLGSAHLGFSSWIMIGAQSQIAGTTSLLLDVRPSSGSAPS